MSNSAGMRDGAALEYVVVDVFAERALEGNALAIFTDARGLTTGEMQALARETNLSETTFVVPRDAATERERGVLVRIFTTEEELKFAGHPTLGTAAWLWQHYAGVQGQEAVTLELPVGPIPVRFKKAGAGEAGVFGTMRQRDAEFGQVHRRAALAAALGLSVEDLEPTVEAQTVSTGMAFCVVVLRSMEAIGRLKIPAAAGQAYLDGSDAKFFYCVARTEEGAGVRDGDGGEAEWHARMQWYSGEDPATGSAAGCAIAYLVRWGLAGSGRGTVIEQGLEIRRPSRIRVQARLDGEAVRDVFVGGRTITVATGRFFLPGYTGY